jgi:Bacterial Ig-like domain (group 3)/FG-GAP-like repeat
MRILSPTLFVRLFAILSFGLLSLLPSQAQTFKNPPLIPTSADVFNMVSADINNDGKLDLIYVDGDPYRHHALHTLLGKGDGTFTHGVDISLPMVCCSLTVADVTKDGKPDLILSGNNALTVTVAVLVGNGDGTFQAPLLTTFQPGTPSNYPLFRSTFAVGDINGDGKSDLALLDTANSQIYLLLGDDSGHFIPGTTIQAFTRTAVYMADLNGDGHLDIVTTDTLGAIFLVYLGKGDGTFPTFTRYNVGIATGAFFFLDVNGDGRPDVLADYFPGVLGYFPGNSDGTFGALVSIGAAPSSGLVAAGDLNSDGIVDLTFATASGIGVALGRSGPSFGPLLTTIAGGSTNVYSSLPQAPVGGDFNGDGYVDLAVAAEGGIVILLGKGDGTFASVDFYDMGQQVGGAAVADFNGDVFPDIAVGLPAAFPRLLLGNGTGKFTLGPDPNPSYGAQPAPITFLAADFNGDGKPDLNLGNIVANQSSAGNQSVALNLGKGVFATPVAVPNSSPVMADLNHDGRMDIIDVTNGQIYASLGQTDGSFKSVTTPLRISLLNGLFNAGDLNNDGKPDLVLNYFDHLEVWLGNGDGTFTYSSSTTIQVVSDVVASIVDLDGDGNADVILAPDYNVINSSGPLAIFYGHGDGTFDSPVLLPISHRYSQVTAVDVNRDNKPDLVMTDGAGIAVMMNLGSRNFDSEVDYIAGRSVSAMNIVDVNSDGFPDIVVANTGGTTVTVLLNQPKGTSTSGALVRGNLSVAPEPSIAGQPFTITLSVAGQTTGSPVPTGSVSFSVDGSFLADAALINGAVSYADTSPLIAAPHTITAMYNGDAIYAPRSFSISHTVQPPTYPTQTVLSASPSTLLASHTLRLSATVSSAVAVPSGSVTFLDGNNTLGSARIDATQTAHFDTALLAPGAHSLFAKFQGDVQSGFSITVPYVIAIFSPSTSAVTPVAVTANQTTVSLTPSSNLATAGALLTLSAQVSSAAGVPFGGVSFFDGNILLGTLPLDSDGTTSFSTASLATGLHAMTATFNANGPFAGSTSAPVNISVNAAAANAIATLISLASQLNLAHDGSSLIATVVAPDLPAGGTVTFLDTGLLLGTAPVDAGGIARLPMAQMNSGTHTLTASFGGVPRYAPSVSPVLYEQWPAAGSGFSLQITTAQRVAPAPAVASLQANIDALGDFRQSIELSCKSGLPHGYTCEFSPESLNGSGNSSLLILPASNTVAWNSGSHGSPGIVAAFVFALLLGSWKNGYSRFVILIAVSFATAVSGCSGGSASSLATSRTVVLTVEASTANSSPMTIHSAQVLVRLPVAD